MDWFTTITVNVLVNLSEYCRTSVSVRSVSITLSTTDKLIQMGKELGYEGQSLQEIVKQQQDTERSERLAERELEKERIAAEKDTIAQVERDREVELAKIAQVEKDREVELTRIAAEKDKTALAEKDRELVLA